MRPLLRSAVSWTRAPVPGSAGPRTSTRSPNSGGSPFEATFRPTRSKEHHLMTLRKSPPFRADHVGSLLRPPVLRQARADRGQGGGTDDELRCIEGEAIP